MRYDPRLHTVAEVLAYLEEMADVPAEVGWVLALERRQLARREILSRFAPGLGGRQLEEPHG